ncbi:MAG TPA: hypothetical protein VFR15_06720 [Chloroflexia bacterium]|nr:hypothetical protein [Chloroflexia bacterium]
MSANSTAARAPKPFKSMRAALKRIVVPALRTRGFTGELPHLRRVTPDATWTFSTRNWKWGGRFIVDLGRAPAGVYQTVTGELIAPTALTSWDLREADRATLRAVPHVPEEVWFSYELTTRDRICQWFERVVRRGTPLDPFERAARAVLEHLPECDRWWAGEAGLPHVRTPLEQLAVQGGAVSWPVSGGTSGGARPGQPDAAF